MSHFDSLLSMDVKRLHTFSVRYEDGECFFRAHYPVSTRTGRTVQRYLEVCCGMAVYREWRYRSGYMYHDDNKFWSVPTSHYGTCQEFAERVAKEAFENAKTEFVRVETVCCRAGISIA